MGCSSKSGRGVKTDLAAETILPPFSSPHTAQGGMEARSCEI